MQLQRNHGFTLTELLVVVAIVAILASIAYPSYIENIRNGRRADAIQTLLEMRISQAKWRANNSTYTSTLSDVNLSSTSLQGYYTIAITSASASGYVATAAPAGTQVGDTLCGTFKMTEAGASYAGFASSSCWKL